MELTLNLVWAAIAVASYALLYRFLAGRENEHARGPSQAKCTVALTCILAILFPVISLTDDLHEMQATLEEAAPSGLVMRRCVADQSSTPDRALHQVLFFFAAFATNARWAILGGVAAVPPVRPSQGRSLPAFGRAPPRTPVRPNELMSKSPQHA